MMVDYVVNAEKEHSIEIEVITTGVRVKWLSGGHMYLDKIMRQGSTTFVIKPPKKKRVRKKKAATQDISSAGGIESDEETETP